MSRKYPGVKKITPNIYKPIDANGYGVSNGGNSTRHYNTRQEATDEAQQLISEGVGEYYDVYELSTGRIFATYISA